MDEVEIIVWEGPKRLCVMEFEATICGNPDGLYRREIGADDFGGRELVRKVSVQGMSTSSSVPR